MSTLELAELKKYLESNLAKGFIAPSQSLFTSLVLFVKKANRSLRFYIDFRKLNALIKKDRYLIPLLDETLDRVSKVKVFTKLDIY